MKKNNKKGFTLAELLIVVAIIGILVAISIPVFTSQLRKAKNATNLANARSLYAQLVADYLDDNKVDADTSGITDTATEITIDGSKYKFDTSVGGVSYSTTSDGAPVITYTPSVSGLESGTWGGAGATDGD